MFLITPDGIGATAARCAAFCNSYACRTVVRCTGTDGGANGTYTLRGTGPIPANFVVTQGNFFVSEVFTGAGTVSLGTATGTPANILAATAIGTMGTAGSKATIPILATVGTHISVTAESEPVLVVASGPLTAGALTLVLEGYFTAIDTQV